jgi:hypothetical protein
MKVTSTVMNPAPNVASDSIRLANWLCEEKEGAADLDSEKTVGDEIVEFAYCRWWRRKWHGW